MTKTKTSTLSVDVGTTALAQMLAGPHHSHIEILESHFGVTIRDESTLFKISGPQGAVQDTGHAIKALLEIAKNRNFDSSDVLGIINHGSEGTKGMSTIATRKKTLTAKTLAQSDFIRALNSHEMIFGVGPAGTGKTYLATAFAASLLEAGAIDRIILTRPAVEAGERLGFLPGDMKEKVDPYLRPLYDALYDMLPPDKIERALASGAIEIAPLAFMRGRTLANAVILVDEAQNTTSMQMKMVLTRLGENSKMIITGDPSQTDLPPHVSSGLKEALNILKNVPEIHVTQFTNKDVIRHKLVGRIVEAYDRHKSTLSRGSDV